MTDNQIVVLQSSDGQEFNLEVKVSKMSETISNLIEDAGVDNAIPLPNVTGKILAKVVEYMKYHTEHQGVVSEIKDERTDDISPWDLDYCKVEQAVMFELILAANYLDIKDLLDLGCKTIANSIKGKTPEEIRKLYNIISDFTPEEEEQVRVENSWCEER